MNTYIPFGNVITAMVTPFKSNLDVDFDQAIKLAHHLIETGTDTLLLAGTTGESPTLTHSEEFELFKTIKDSVGKRVHVMAGTGSNCTKTAIQATKKAQEAAIDSVLQVVPYYNKPSQQGMIAHFSAIAENTTLPIMLYNIPSRTGSFLEPSSVLKLSSLPNVCAIKEASGSVETVSTLNELLPEDFLIYSGDDGKTLEFLKNGAVGVVSVASHCMGQKIQDMIKAYKINNLDQAHQIHDELNTLFDVLFITSNPVPVKYALSKQRLCLENVRLPLVHATSEQKQAIDNVLNSLGI